MVKTILFHTNSNSKGKQQLNEKNRIHDKEISLKSLKPHHHNLHDLRIPNVQEEQEEREINSFLFLLQGYNKKKM